MTVSTTNVFSKCRMLWQFLASLLSMPKEREKKKIQVKQDNKSKRCMNLVLPSRVSSFERPLMPVWHDRTGRHNSKCCESPHRFYFLWLPRHHLRIGEYEEVLTKPNYSSHTTTLPTAHPLHHTRDAPVIQRSTPTIHHCLTCITSPSLETFCVLYHLESRLLTHTRVRAHSSDLREVWHTCI